MLWILVPFCIFVAIGSLIRIVHHSQDRSLHSVGTLVLVGSNVLMLVWAIILAVVAIVK